MFARKDNVMRGMRIATIVFLAFGILLIGWGHFQWMSSHRSESAKIHCLVALIPGWSLIIMSWIGLAAERLYASLKGMQD